MASTIMSALRNRTVAPAVRSNLFFTPSHLPTRLPSSLVRTSRQNLSSTTRSSPRPTSTSNSFTFTSHRFQASLFRSQTPGLLFRRLFSRSLRRRNAPSPNPTPHLGSPPTKENLSLSQRLKKLSREYGWSALGVYLLLSALDFPFCYLLVRTLGTDRIGEWEEIIVSNVKRIIPEEIKAKWHEWRESVKAAEKEYTGKEIVTDGVEMAGWGVEEAEANHKKEASLGTQLALAYAIHKSFIFVRVPLTAAVTPKIVKVLRGWGWDIGKRTTKAAKAAKRAEVAAAKPIKKV